MDRAALARELFDIHQAMRDQVQVAKLAATTREGHDSATALGILVERADKIVEGYVASAMSGAHHA